MNKMGNYDYLIPANSKKSMLILGMFNMNDLFILGTGLTITVILLFVMKTNSLQNAVMILIPFLTSVTLVLPLPNEHNVRTFIKNVYDYFMNQKEYRWKGWCIKDGEESK